MICRLVRLAAVWCFTMAGVSCSAQPPGGLAGKYPNDVGIEKDPAILFTENFESGDLARWEEKKGPVSLTEDQPHTGRACVAMPMTRGKDTGGSQFFICMNRTNTAHLDGVHTCFGRVVEGLDVIDQIRQGDLILNIEIFKDQA